MLKRGLSVMALLVALFLAAWTHGVASTNRILIILYGQSNMDNFTKVGASPPAAVAGTQYYNGTSLGAVPAADGIRYLLNSVATATGKTVLALNGSVGGSATAGLIKGTSAYTALLAQINAVSQPTDQCFILWDQGEGDADATPHPDENTYKAILSQLHSDIVSDIGRTKVACPFITSGKGTANTADGTLNGGTTDVSWQTIKNAQYNASLEQQYLHFSHTDIDFVRTDGYHYDGASQGRAGQRFGQTVNTILALASGEAHWQISNGATVDVTHTNINVVHNLGTDFTPTSGGNGWEVSGDNGATWSAATASRNNATQVSLTHSSISTTSTRLVRYQWGQLPPNASGVNPTTAPILDNSALQVPLNPTTWNIRPTPLSALPVPTWRYNVALTGSGQVQTTTNVPLGPSIGAQKFVIISLAGVGLNGTATLTPRTATGAASGTPVTSTLIRRQANAQLLQATLGADANNAYSVDVSVDYGSNAFGGSIIQLWSVPLADLASTTATGSNGNSATSATADTTTVNVSAGGFIIQAGWMNTGYTTANVLTGTETYAKRYEQGSGIPTYSADASNCGANAASSMTATFAVSGNIDLVTAAWR